MEGTAKRQVKAEEMLAELKRALKSSTPAPNAPPPSASTAARSTSPARDNRQSQIDRESDHTVKAKADRSNGQPPDLEKSTRPSSRRWTLTAGAIALASAAVVGTSFALMNKASDLPEREPSVAATEAPVRSQNERLLKPSNDSRSLIEGSRQAAPLQTGNLETLPDASTAPAINGSISAHGKAEVDTPNLASSGLETTAPAFTPIPPSTPAILAPSQVIRLDGTPIATAPSTPASTVSAPPLAQTPKTEAPSAARQTVKPDKASIATAPRTSASTISAPPLAQTPKPAAPSAAPQMVKPDKASIATAPPTPASTISAPPLARMPKPAAPSAAPQMVKPDNASIATAPPARASTDSVPPPAQRPKPNATRTASVPSESAERSTPKINSMKKPPENRSVQKPAKSTKASAKSVRPAERQSTQPAPPKEAEPTPEPPQGAGNPTAAGACQGAVGSAAGR